MTLSLQLRTMIESFQLDANYIEDLVVRTIAEDLAGGVDVTSEATIPKDQISIAEFRSRKAGVVSGLCIAAAVLEVRGITNYKIVRTEGDHIEAGQLLITATGNTRQLLLTERTALNFLGRLSGISSLTKRWVDDVKGTGVEIRDTRKTTPLLRDLEKFAVRMGGGTNHRMSLSDAALIKDNHIVAAGGVTQAFKAVRAAFPDIAVEVEVDRLEQLRDVVTAGADLVLLDNMSLEQCRAAVAMVKGKTKLEASGGLTLENAHAYASTGVDYLAVGALTHSAPVLDIGLDFKAE
ncbi:MAG: carboxylating nicotinate-nucleotide diphosphorylase [Actinomycetes bacterium]